MKAVIYIGGIASVFAAWTLLASSAFHWLSGGIAPYDCWFYYARPWPDDRTWCAYLVISAIMAALPVLAIVSLAIWMAYRGRLRRLTRPLGGGIRPVERSVTDNHGHADWPTVADLLKRYPPPADGHGVVIGEARRIDLEPVKDTPFDPDDPKTWGQGGKAELLLDDGSLPSPHSLMFVGTGGLKTMHAISTQHSWRESLVTFDPSCEIGPMAKRHRESLGQKVTFIGYGPERTGINVFAAIQPHRHGAASRIASIVASMCGEDKDRKKGDKNDVFSDAGKNLIACLIAHMMSDSRLPDSQKTVEGFINAIESVPEDKMQAQLRTISKTSESQYARRLAGIVMGTHHETFSGAYFNATSSIGYLLDPEVARLLSAGMNPAEILDGGHSVYIQIPTADLMYADGIGRMIVDSIVNSVIMADGDYTERMLLQCDEAWLLKNMRSLDVVLQQGRKYGMPIQLIYTSLNRARVIWGDEGLESWLEGVGWTGYAAVSSATAKKLSEEIGTRGVLAHSEGTNQGSSSQALGSGSWSRGSNVSTHEIKRNLINPDEFKDARTDELFVVPRNGRPFRCGMAPYFRRDEMLADIDPSPFRKEKEAA